MSGGFVSISDTETKGNSLRIRFHAKGRVARFFKKKELNVEYGVERLEIPHWIARLPLICNILPLVWAMNAQLNIDTLDRQSARSFEFLQGVFRQCYPNLAWNGSLMVGEVVDTDYHNSVVRQPQGSLVFFSGGVDSLATYFRHKEENPALITVWGADCDPWNMTAWDHIWSHTKAFAERIETKAFWIRSDFKDLLDYRRVDSRFKSVLNRSWWGAVQHALGLIGLGIPLAHTLKINKIYLGAGWWQTANYFDATSWGAYFKPRFGQCDAIIDGWELTRQEKVRLLVSRLASPIEIRVCWQSPTGKNCGRCEKCSRTILALEIEGADPNLYGFRVDGSTFANIKSHLEKGSWLSDPSAQEFWGDIQKSIQLKSSLKLPHKGATQLVKWLLKFDMGTSNRKSMLSAKIVERISSYLAISPQPLFETVCFLHNLSKHLKKTVQQIFSSGEGM